MHLHLSRDAPPTRPSNCVVEERAPASTHGRNVDHTIRHCVFARVAYYDTLKLFRLDEQSVSLWSQCATCTSIGRKPLYCCNTSYSPTNLSSSGLEMECGSPLSMVEQTRQVMHTPIRSMITWIVAPA